jgi:hypothetical protein
MRRGGGRNQSGGNLGGRGLLGSVPHGESGFGNVQPSPGLLGPGLQAASMLNNQGSGGFENLLRSSGILGGLPVGGVGGLAGAGLGAGVSLLQQQELLRQQQAALLLNSALVQQQQQQQGLFNTQQGLIGNRPVGLDAGNSRMFGVSQRDVCSLIAIICN